VTVATPIVAIRDLVKEYRRGAEVLRVLDGLSIEIDAGDFVALMARRPVRSKWRACGSMR
jgi:ABC-type dipeptide/oligopeptide/nickel transport system ATPase subunit